MIPHLTHRGVVAGFVWCTMCALLVVASATSARAQAGRARRVVPRAAVATADSATVPTIRAGLLVRPDTVAVGDPFTLVVTIEVPTDATVQWATIGDTAAVVAMRAPTRVTSEVQGATRRETAEYALAAWNVGTLPLGVPNASVRTSNGIRAVPLREAHVVVMTVLPADTSLRVPKPLRGLFPRAVPWWEAWWPAAAVVAALAVLWWLWRRRRHRVVRQVPVPVDVFARAIHDFERLQRLALADLGERGRAVALGVEILRTYLAARLPTAPLSETSSELLASIGADSRVPTDRLASLLADVDAIKFAHRPVSGIRARELQDEALAVVKSVEQADQARRKHEAAVKLASERVARDNDRVAKRTAEDEARRRSRRAKSGVT